MSAVDAINIIRNRVGAVPVRNEYKANKEIFRERIRNERAVELCLKTIAGMISAVGELLRMQ